MNSLPTPSENTGISDLPDEKRLARDTGPVCDDAFWSQERFLPAPKDPDYSINYSRKPVRLV